ncbi:DinB family protein [Actinomadura madurae]|uniref:DinB family protein n=1 Tax=Actinomadura madurae TaxID=1993 RepID=UPI002026969F|nr:DinB family protein [Actinomadura madurae]MCP9952238.1 DinB family protein [Actinomadura madurae]MCP9969003.1 DinB family protein [Actinomadura madurae]MCP9981471.1 DinB family protein [Actinomadura madurae]MCQ0007014.1 DinB family protein [Actinomadura madurae]URM97773.1 DinB family protein [Actinomadura madurae]
MVWTAPEVDRSGFPTAGDESTSLETFLDFHRRTLLLKCGGLNGGQLAAKPLPSTNLSLLGLVRHLAENERWWFRNRFGNDASAVDLYCSEEYPDGDFDLGHPDGAEADFATYAREVELARATTAGRSLDEEFPAKDGMLTLRWVYLHMIEEYARHNGHADLLREAIDGVTGE